MPDRSYVKLGCKMGHCINRLETTEIDKKLQALRNFPMKLLFWLQRPMCAPWFILCLFMKTHLLVLMQSNSRFASLCFFVQVVWMHDEYSNVLSTPNTLSTLRLRPMKSILKLLTNNISLLLDKYSSLIDVVSLIKDLNC